MSVNLAEIMELLGVPDVALLDGHVGFSLVSVTAGVVREVTQDHERRATRKSGPYLCVRQEDQGCATPYGEKFCLGSRALTNSLEMLGLR